MSASDLGGLGRSQLLKGWKEVGAYFGRDETTVRRWAASMDLPVHRVPGRKRASIYADPAELDAWLKRNREVGPAAATDAPEAAPRPAGQRRRLIAVAIGCAAIVLAIVLAVILASGFATSGLRSTAGVSQSARLQAAPEARKLFLDGVYLLQKRTPDALAQAGADLGRAVELEPTFAEAHAALATAYNLMVEYHVLPAADGYARSESAAARAVELDPEIAQAQTVLADIEFFWRRRIDAGLERFRTAVELDPNNAQARHWRASALAFSGRFQEAEAEIDKAQALDPRSRAIRVTKSIALLGEGDLDTAEKLLLQLIENEPNYRIPFRFLAYVHLARSDYPNYIAALEKFFELSGDPLGREVAAAGREGLDRGGSAAMAAAMASAARARAASGAVEPYLLAHLHALAGDWEAAARQLAEIETRHMFYYVVDPAFMSARRDDGFRQRMTQLGLPVIR